MGDRATKSSPACGPKLALGERQLISSREADALERTFKVLANGTRLRLLHALVLRPGISVTELARVIGMKPQAVSNQLQRLTDKAILASFVRAPVFATGSSILALLGCWITAFA